MTELRQRMLDAMVQRGFAVRTQDAYVRAIRRMAKHYRRDPAQYTREEVQAYLLHMVKDEKLSYSSMNQAACASQFLFQTVLGHGREQFQVPFAKVPAKQPELLGREEIARLFTACLHPAKRMLLQTMYATGLRVSEACVLKVCDIDSARDRMCVRVQHGKGGRGRQSILSPTLLELLRAYVRYAKPRLFMRRVAQVDLYQCPCCQLGRLRLVETLRGCKTLPAPGAHNAITPQCTGPP